MHAYWPLIEELDPEEWKIYAEGLKALSHEHGLEADHGCTADASRVLRPARHAQSQANAADTGRGRRGRAGVVHALSARRVR